MSIAQEIVNAHGGEIGVESAGLGQGSMFWFAIPQTAAITPKEPAEQAVSDTKGV